MKTLKLLALVLFALTQVALATQIVDQIPGSRPGQFVAGSLRISWPAFTNTAGQAVPAGTVTVPVTNGRVNVTLTPYSNYTVVYVLPPSERSTEYWNVPDSASPLTIQQVKVPAPTPPSNNGGGTTSSGPTSYAVSFNVQTYTTGTASVVNGSNVVTGNGAAWDSSMTGRMFFTADCNLGYIFTYVSPTSGTLEAPWGCPSISGAIVTGAVAGPYNIVEGVNDQMLLSCSGGPDIAVIIPPGSQTSTQVEAVIQTALSAVSAPCAANESTAAVGQVRLINTKTDGATISIKPVVNDAYSTLGFTAGDYSTGLGTNYWLSQFVRIPGVTHQLGTADLSVTCYSSAGSNPNQLTRITGEHFATVDVDTDTFNVLVMFLDAQQGRCVIHK